MSLNFQSAYYATQGWRKAWIQCLCPAHLGSCDGDVTERILCMIILAHLLAAACSCNMDSSRTFVMIFGRCSFGCCSLQIQNAILVHLPLYCICMRPELCDWNNGIIRLRTMVRLLCCVVGCVKPFP